jgi:hypothetical protein
LDRPLVILFMTEIAADPDCATKATRPGARRFDGRDGYSGALSVKFTRPMQFGPLMDIAVAAPNARIASSCSALKPLENTLAERTPAASSWRSVCSTSAAGTATMAVSTPAGRACAPLNAGKPSTSAALGCTGRMRPW